jgi:hypothetical protein
MRGIRLWEWLPIYGWRVVATVESADEVPTRLPRNGAVVVGSRERPKWVAFDCPCRSGHRILLSTDRSRWPCWSIAGHRPLTISPSVDYNDGGRRCHYFVKRGRIRWVTEEDAL